MDDFFLQNESIRIDSHNESIRIANWNALSRAMRDVSMSREEDVELTTSPLLLEALNFL